jgi:two-component system, NarL family, nitrate/nitrite response regulator NarL
MRKPFSAVVIEPCNLFREGLVRLLGINAFDVEAAVSCVSDLTLEQRDTGVAVILGETGDVATMASQIRDIKQRCSSAKVVILGSPTDFERIRAALNAGADGYLDKVVTPVGLLKSLELIMQDGIALPREVIATLASEPGRVTALLPRNDVLSSRESRVLRCLLEGDSNKLIARRYAMAESTVKVHVKSIFRKIGAKNRTQAAIWAMHHTEVMDEVHA